MKQLESTVPKPRALLALKNQSWSAGGAISELVDNSFGAGRGNADAAHVTWNKKKRTLEIIDDGQGMDHAAELFQLGQTVGLTPGDIGYYGSGGTMALLWLADRAEVWTMRNGRVSGADVVWSDIIEADEYPDIDVSWQDATKKNTPRQLLSAGGGTMIRMHVPSKRRIWESNIKRDLARNYGGPAYRHGKRLTWTTIGKRGKEETIALTEREELGDGVDLSVSIEVDGDTLGADGRAAIVEDTPISESKIAVCFGPRAILFTKECYRSPDGEESYDGIGVKGYVDLGEGWQPYLSTTKTDIDDDRAWSALMSSLFQQLRPLLERRRRERFDMLFEDIQLDLETLLKPSRSHVEGPELSVSSAGSDKGKGPTKDSGSTETKRSDRPGVLGLQLIGATDEEIGGELCQAVVVGGRSIDVYVNQDHERVQHYLEARPPNKDALYLVVVTGIAKAIVVQAPGMFSEMFKSTVADELHRRREEGLDNCLGYLIRLLMDRVKEGVA